MIPKLDLMTIFLEDGMPRAFLRASLRLIKKERCGLKIELL